MTMELRILGKTGVKVSTVGMGCWQIGGPVPGVRKGWTGVTDKESIATVHHCLDVGINLLDTAEGYGNGHSEKIIGQAIKTQREKYIVATKVEPNEISYRYWSTETTDQEARKRIVEGCENSLKRLQTDYIDIYQLHKIPQKSTINTVMESLNKLKTDGKIRWIGVSTNDLEKVKELMRCGEISILQIAYNLLNREGEDVLNFAATKNLGTLIKSPLASGALSGKYFNKTPNLDKEDRRINKFTSQEAVKKFRMLSKLQFLTKDERRTMTDSVLRFILDTPGVTCVIPGAKNRKQLEQNARAMAAPKLTSQERERAIKEATKIGVI